MLHVSLALVLVILATAPAARADDDPASDVLLSQDVFYGDGIDLESKPAAQLPAMLATAREHGLPIKIALISAFTDLGSVTHLWLMPADYARYLATELSLVYRGRLLIVMRNGYAILDDQNLRGSDRRVLSRLEPPRRAARFLSHAIEAVRKVAAANGVKLAVPDVEPPPGGVKMGIPHAAAAAPVATATAAPRAAIAARDSGTWLFLVPVGVLALAAAVAALRRRAAPRR